jgi:hypothetical protein
MVRCAEHVKALEIGDVPKESHPYTSSFKDGLALVTLLRFIESRTYTW